ncbi:hypothetical protein U1Q18_032948 [Sarracenia purpurea var. burkii]
MESPEEFTASNDHNLILKGKSTKRQRLSSTSSGGGVGGSGGGCEAADGDGVGDGVYSSSPSPASSGEIAMRTEEDEDMANCLILLARGVGQRQVKEDRDGKHEKFSSRRSTETATATGGKVGLFVYECKTCSRIFPSFQALGGHRASHKKPKTVVEEKRELPATAPPLVNEEEEEAQEQEEEEEEKEERQFTKASHVNNKQPKVHGCSICGSEFSSGQALGGHMRRHRAVVNSRTTPSGGDAIATESSREESEDKPRKILRLDLDLNLPAPPEDDHHGDGKFQFTPNKQHLVFSGLALVDCHY